MTHLLAFLFALCESVLGLGVLVPGEVAITGIAVGVTGAAGTVWLVIAVAGGAVLGDNVGFLIGHRGGSRLRGSRMVRRVGVDRWDHASGLVRRYGMPAVVVSRMLPYVRTVTPAIAGASGMSYPAFAAASMVGSVGWAALWVLAGRLVAGLVGSVLGDGEMALRIVAAVVVLVFSARVLPFAVRRRRPRGRGRHTPRMTTPEPALDPAGV